MYAAAWNLLPGPLWFRILLAVAVVAAVLFALATWVFPWVDAIVNPQEATVGSP